MTSPDSRCRCLRATWLARGVSSTKVQKARRAGPDFIALHLPRFRDDATALHRLQTLEGLICILSFSDHLPPTRCSARSSKKRPRQFKLCSSSRDPSRNASRIETELGVAAHLVSPWAQPSILSPRLPPHSAPLSTENANPVASWLGSRGYRPMCGLLFV